jgi:NAD-dependent dihydropyrimidine dehydrogenase PreA subunit
MLRYLADTVTLELDAEKCNGCRMCLAVCPQGVFAITDRCAVIRDRDACMECGACALNCEPGALSVRRGVGCAAGIIAGKLCGTEPTCGCSDDSGSCC